ncbi:MAG: NAD(+) diphosphatase [Bacteroidaceae bacterium]|nr:NAD(+) diphosphatase [Bacteroidaceae bacterium]
METKRYWYVFCQDELLLEKVDGRWGVPFQAEPPVAVEPWTVQLNPDPRKNYTTISIAAPVEEDERWKMIGLRASYDILDREHYLLAGKCRELLFWDLNNKFCGCCGGPLKFNSPISKKCTMCGKEIWPNVAVATIVLIRREDKVLLVHAKNFRGKFYGLVAGFVETGETLEDCVKREVKEEVGLEIKNIKYFSSQPWPYPCGLMVGFTADYEKGEIHLQRTELSGGKWFTKDNLPELPQKLSIARMLIDDWIKKEC